MWGYRVWKEKDLQVISCKSLKLLVRPARFERAAYGFEEQDSTSLKRLWLQPVDSKPFFQMIFGFVWNCFEKFDLDGHNLGTALI